MKQHVSDIIPSAKGNLNQEQQGLQSRKLNAPIIFQIDKNTIILKIAKLKKQEPLNESLEDTISKILKTDAFPSAYAPNIKTNKVAYAIVKATPKNKEYTDLIGHFPYRSSRGN